MCTFNGIITEGPREQFNFHFLSCFNGYVVGLLASLIIILDNFSEKPWLGSDLVTVGLGSIFFESFGITGLEAFAAVACLVIYFASPNKEKKFWKKTGLFNLLVVATACFFGFSVALLVGISNGGNPIVHFQQTRFLHLFPMYTLMGFVIFKNKEFVFAFMKFMAIATMLKAWQALYVVYSVLGADFEAEYLIDHTYSSFVVLAIVFCAFYLLNFRTSVVFKLFFWVSLPVLIQAYIWNDRRSATFGGIFAVIFLVGTSMLQLLRYDSKKVLRPIMIILLYTGATWYLPPPIGMKSLLQSVGVGGPPKAEPTYREKETGNLIQSLVSAGVLGYGTGREFIEAYPLPASMVKSYPRYKSIPHNQLFSIWAYGGPLAMAGLGIMFVLAFYFSSKLFKRTDPFLKLIGIFGYFLFTQFLVLTFADMGYQNLKIQFFAGLFFGIMARQCFQNPLIMPSLGILKR